jgi:hypothetical protein
VLLVVVACCCCCCTIPGEQGITGPKVCSAATVCWLHRCAEAAAGQLAHFHCSTNRRRSRREGGMSATPHTGGTAVSTSRHTRQQPPQHNILTAVQVVQLCRDVLNPQLVQAEGKIGQPLLGGVYWVWLVGWVLVLDCCWVARQQACQRRSTAAEPSPASAALDAPRVTRGGLLLLLPSHTSKPWSHAANAWGRTVCRRDSATHVMCVNVCDVMRVRRGGLAHTDRHTQPSS